MLDEWTPVEMAENDLLDKSTSIKAKDLEWFSVSEHNGRLFKFGGMKVIRKFEKHYPNVAVFVPGKNTWEELDPMRIARRSTEIFYMI